LSQVVKHAVSKRIQPQEGKNVQTAEANQSNQDQLFIAVLDALRAWDTELIGHNGMGDSNPKNCPACKFEAEVVKVAEEAAWAARQRKPASSAAHAETNAAAVV
jgi:hypothetical protein